MITFTFGDPSLIVQGIVEQTMYNRATGDVVAYDRIATEGSINYTFEVNEVTGGFLAPLVGLIPHSARLTGSYTTQGFSLAQRALQTGGALSYGGVAPFCEQITANSSTLTVTGNPRKSLAQFESDTTGWCQVREHGATSYPGVNYEIDLSTKQVVNFVATSGKTYDVFYTADYTSAQVLALPGAPDPAYVSVVRKYGVYKTQNGKAAQSTLAGYMYVIVPNAMLGGDAGIDANQTTAATSALTWTAVSASETVPSCDDCNAASDPLGFYTFVPCGDPKQDVQALAIVGGTVSVVGGVTNPQMPVKYVMKDDTLVQPVYSDLSFVSADTGVVTVDANGVLTGHSEGTTTVTVTLTKESGNLTAVANVTVQ